MKQDVLADVLQTLRVDAAEYQQLNFLADQSITVEDDRTARFYAVLAGSVLVQVDLGEPLELSSGDLLLLPHGGGHRLASSLTPAIPAVALRSWEGTRLAPVEPLQAASGSPEVVSGRISFQQENYRHWWELLPSMVLSRRQAESFKWLESTLGFVTSEANAQRPGGQTLVSRLTDLLVLHVIRSHLAMLDSRADDSPRWLAALADPQMGAALALLHQKPAEPWTVRDLARKVGMSRSAFAARFTRQVGEPPLHYLTRLRMQQAAGLLRGSWASTSEVAERVGYVSDTAFCKAFKRAFGMSPGSFRRTEKGGFQARAA